MAGRMGGWIVGGWVDQGQQGGSAVTEVKQMDKWGKGVHMHEGPYCCIIQNKKIKKILTIFYSVNALGTKQKGEGKKHYFCSQYQ